MLNNLMPQDRRLIQESLDKVSEGPEALMKWAKEHYNEIDQKFINLLRKMIEYTKNSGQEELSKTFVFLDTCFSKMFDFHDQIEQDAITKDNVKQFIEKSSKFLNEGRPKKAISILNAVSIFLAHVPNRYYQSIVESNLGTAYSQVGQLEKGLRYFENAYKLVQSDSDRKKVLTNIKNTIEKIQAIKSIE